MPQAHHSQDFSAVHEQQHMQHRERIRTRPRYSDRPDESSLASVEYLSLTRNETQVDLSSPVKAYVTRAVFGTPTPGSMDPAASDHDEDISHTMGESLVFSTWDPDHRARANHDPDVALIAQATSPPVVMTSSGSSASASSSNNDCPHFEPIDPHTDHGAANRQRRTLTRRRRSQSGALTSPATIARLQSSADATISSSSSSSSSNNNNDRYMRQPMGPVDEDKVSNAKRYAEARIQRDRQSSCYNREIARVPYYQPGPIMRASPRTFNQLYQDDNSDELVKMKRFMQKLRQAEKADADDGYEGNVDEEKKELNRNQQQQSTLQYPAFCLSSLEKQETDSGHDHSYSEYEHDHEQVERHNHPPYGPAALHQAAIQTDNDDDHVSGQIQRLAQYDLEHHQPVHGKRIAPAEDYGQRQRQVPSLRNRSNLSNEEKKEQDGRQFVYDRQPTYAEKSDYNSYQMSHADTGSHLDRNKQQHYRHKPVSQPNQHIRSERTQELMRRAEHLTASPHIQQAVPDSPEWRPNPPRMHATPRRSNRQEENEYTSGRASPTVIELLSSLKGTSPLQKPFSLASSSLSRSKECSQPRRAAQVGGSLPVSTRLPLKETSSSEASHSQSPQDSRQSYTPRWSSYTIGEASRNAEVYKGFVTEEETESYSGTAKTESPSRTCRAPIHDEMGSRRVQYHTHSSLRDSDMPVSEERRVAHTKRSERHGRKRHSIPRAHTYEHVSSDLTGCKNGLPKVIWRLFRDCAEIDDSTSEASAELYPDESTFNDIGPAEERKVLADNDLGWKRKSCQDTAHLRNSHPDPRTTHGRDQTKSKLFADARTLKAPNAPDESSTLFTSARDGAVALKSWFGQLKGKSAEQAIEGDDGRSPIFIENEISVADGGRSILSPKPISDYASLSQSPCRSSMSRPVAQTADEEFMQAFLSQLTTHGFPLYSHQHLGSPTLQTPGKVTAYLRLGRESPATGRFSQPALIWLDNSGTTHGIVGLFEIRSLEKGVAPQLKEFPLIDLDRSIVLLTERSSFVFNAPSQEVTDQFILGMRLTIAALANNLVKGNGAKNSELLKLNKTNLATAETRALNDLANELANSAGDFIRNCEVA